MCDVTELSDWPPNTSQRCVRCVRDHGRARLYARECNGIVRDKKQCKEHKRTKEQGERWCKSEKSEGEPYTHAECDHCIHCGGGPWPYFVLYARNL